MERLHVFVAHRQNGGWTDQIPPIRGTKTRFMVDLDGRIVVAANFPEALDEARVARFDGARWQGMDEKLWYDIEALVTHQGVLYASGLRGTVHDVGSRDVARWTGITWESIRPPDDGLLPDGNLGDIYLIGAESGSVYLSANRTDSRERLSPALLRWSTLDESWSELDLTSDIHQLALQIGAVRNGRAFVLGATTTRPSGRFIDGARTVEVFDLISGQHAESRDLTAVFTNDGDELTQVNAIEADEDGTVYRREGRELRLEHTRRSALFRSTDWMQYRHARNADLGVPPRHWSVGHRGLCLSRIRDSSALW